MPNGGWREPGSPFHRGEREIQERLGVHDRLEDLGRRVIRDFMPDQHREFFARLPYLVVGTVDDENRPWASILVGNPRFVTSPEPRRLKITARPLVADPLNETLAAGTDIGLLGIDLHSRRRNRLNGRVVALGEEGFEVAVAKSFGNCPQYIQARPAHSRALANAPLTKTPVHRGDHLDKAARDLIGRSDTFFIATSYSEDHADIAQGVDVSHRGGKPGFVRVEDERTFVFPDFSGNNHFNTLGNILLNPRAGFLFVDFERGDLLYLTGGAEIIWEGDELAAFEGAQRLVRFRVTEVIRVGGSLPLWFYLHGYSRTLARTGSWEQAAERGAAKPESGWPPAPGLGLG